MQFVVELSVSQRDFTDSMAQMRTWFDRRRIEPQGFRHSTHRLKITFRVGFSIETEATAFAQAFGGRLIGSLIDAPEEAEAVASYLR